MESVITKLYFHKNIKGVEMAIALLEIVEEEFIPSSQKDLETPTKFIIKTLDGLQHMGCLSHEGYDRTKVLECGLKDWKNFIGPEGDLVPFSFRYVKLIPPSDLYEIVTAIINESKFDGTEASS